jgi:hypothetical protein
LIWDCAGDAPDSRVPAPTPNAANTIADTSRRFIDTSTVILHGNLGRAGPFLLHRPVHPPGFLRDVHEVTVQLHLDEKREPGPAVPPAIGSILRVSPVVDAVIGVPGAVFDRVWTLAVSGQLHYCWLAFTEPPRGLSLIVSASFSKGAEE